MARSSAIRLCSESLHLATDRAEGAYRSPAQLIHLYVKRHKKYNLRLPRCEL